MLREQHFDQLIIWIGFFACLWNVAAEILFESEAEESLEFILSKIYLLLYTFDLKKYENLREENLNGRNDIGSSEFSSIYEVIDLFDQVLSEFFVSRDDGFASIKDKIMDLSVHFRVFLLAIVESPQQNLEWNHELLTWCKAHNI